MTREEELQKAAVYFCDKTNPQLLVGDYSFIQGAKWADANPKSLWISVEEDLPFKHKKLLYEDTEFLSQATKLVLIRTEENTHGVSIMYNDGHGWQWDYELGKITHWMPIPEI